MATRAFSALVWTAFRHPSSETLARINFYPSVYPYPPVLCFVKSFSCVEQLFHAVCQGVLELSLYIYIYFLFHVFMYIHVHVYVYATKITTDPNLASPFSLFRCVEQLMPAVGEDLP